MAQRHDPTKEFLAAIGENIRYFRKKKGFTLEALGEDIGLDKSNMHHIESGRNLTLITLLKIATFLEIDPAKLLQTDVNVSLEDAEAYINRKKDSRKRARRSTKKKKKR
ncbi:MAG TPA: helix-turn-helix transcriptional regulator [Bacteroidia bacterium]|nr:helix-turn-helix transcriptional regulator [Bacteroidia bacterium]